MTVTELIEELESCDPDAEVRLAHQPSWPFEYSISAAVELDPNADADETADHTEVVYLVEGAQLGYLSGAVATEIGWGR